jgi:hypothetical protein
MKETLHFIYFLQLAQSRSFKKSIERYYFNVKNILIWGKNNTGMGDLERGDYT